MAVAMIYPEAEKSACGNADGGKASSVATRSRTAVPLMAAENP
jgi:hypothetical protein